MNNPNNARHNINRVMIVPHRRFKLLLY
jgi:hypothetical protein